MGCTKKCPRFTSFWRFIKNFSTVTALITKLTKGDLKDFGSGKRQVNTFATINKLFTTAPIRRQFALGQQNVVETDTSDYALGFVLLLGFVLFHTIDKRLHPLPFYCWKLNNEELNYEICDKELLATVTAFKQWGYYLEGSQLPAILYIDHKNLEYLIPKTLQLNRWQARVHVQVWLGNYLSTRDGRRRTRCTFVVTGLSPSRGGHTTTGWSYIPQWPGRFDWPSQSGHFIPVMNSQIHDNHTQKIQEVFWV